MLEIISTRTSELLMLC